MEGRQFDRIARALAAAATRRAGLAALIGSVAGAGSAAAIAAARPRGRRTPGAEGPCKSTRRPDNVCTRDSECCTNICNRKTGDRNRDRKGRCRCIRRGGPCTATHNCCSRAGQQMVCTRGVCGEANPAPPPPPPPPSCQADVCSSGCEFSSVQAAIDAAASGATIVIGPGTWDEDILVGKDVTLTCCPSEVTTLRNATANRRTILFDSTASTLPTLTIRDLVITKSDASGQDGGGIAGQGHLVLEGATIIEDCQCDNFCKGGGVALGDGTSTPFATLVMSGNSIIRNCIASEGAGVFLDSYATATFSGQAKLQGNTASSDGGGLYTYYKSAATINGSAEISGNTAVRGGGVYYYGYGSGASIAVNAGVTITGNTATNGAGNGGGIFGDGSEGTATVNGGASISGNTPDQCAGTVSC